MAVAAKELPPDLLAIAKRDLNEDPKRRRQDIDAIKIWLKKQPHLTARDDDQWILTFLRGCKFSLERTKEKLDTYYTYKTMLPEFFGNRDPFLPEIQELLKLGPATPLPKPDKHGRQIFLIRAAVDDPKKHKMGDLFRLNYMHMDAALLENDRGIIAGDVVVLDFKNTTFEHMTRMTPSLIKKSMAVYQDAYPIRPQAVHYINTNSFFEASFNIFKSFMKKKLQDRLYVHGSDFNKLYEYVPKELLPSDYGGDLPCVEELTAEWKKKMEKHRDWFLEDSKYGTDEKKRPGKPKTLSEIFGVEGSFRSLEVD